MTPENNAPNPEIAALKNQVFTLLMALLVVSGTLTVYLFRQASLTGSDLAQAKQLNVLVTQNEATLESFLGQLVEYGKKHPDFLVLLKKYGITPGAAPIAPAAAAAPAAAPKK